MPVLLLITIGAAVAFVWPETVLWLKPALKPAFAVTMLSVGTLVKPAQVREFAARPARTLSGLSAQYTIMPVLAWLVSRAFADPTLQTGIILVGCMPGAMASNVMTVLFRGDLILSVAMTTVATVLAPVVLSFWLPILAGTSIELPVQSLTWSAAWMVAIPVAIGITIRARWTHPPDWWDRTAGSIASAAIILIVLVVVAANQERLGLIGPALALAMLGLNLGGYAAAWLAGKWLGWPPAQRRTLVLEVGLQNAGLGSVLALSHLGDAAAIPSAFYTFLCVLTSAMALPVVNRFNQSSTVAVGS